MEKDCMSNSWELLVNANTVYVDVEASSPMTSPSSCLEEPKPIRILSYGGGIQTTALLLLHPERYTHAIFADTGNEHQQTYDYINEVVIPFCKLNGIEFIHV